MEHSTIGRTAQTRDVVADELQWGTLRHWAQLVRLPNVFTLFSDCIAAAVVATHLAWPLTAFLPTLVASLFAYWAGMILNDVVDIEDDRQTRPERPLAAGDISPVIAGHVANGMLLVAPIIILAVMTVHKSLALWMGIAFLAAILLSMSVRAYNSPIKQTPLGPLLMGACRGLNILMVGFVMLAVTFYPTTEKIDGDLMVAPVDVTPVTWNQLDQLAAPSPTISSPSTKFSSVDPLQSGLATQSSKATSDSRDLEAISEPLPDVIFPRPLLALAAGIGLYILGVTVYARREEHESSPAGLLFGMIIELAGLVVIGCLPLWAAKQTWTLNPNQGYPLLIALIGLTVMNRGFAGVMHPVSRKVQLAVRHAILTLVLIDAAVVLMWVGTWWGCAVAALLLPALSSAMRFRST